MEQAEGGDTEEAAGGASLPLPPRLPERASIYITPDGTVHFGALFEGLLPVAEALGGATAEAEVQSMGPHPRPASRSSPGSDRKSG